MSLEKKLKNKAKTLKDWELECKQLIPKDALYISNKSEKWIAYDTFYLAELVCIDDVLKILSDHKQKLRELADLLKNRPRYTREMHDAEICFKALEKKFAELGLDTKKEK